MMITRQGKGKTKADAVAAAAAAIVIKGCLGPRLIKKLAVCRYCKVEMTRTAVVLQDLAGSATFFCG